MTHAAANLQGIVLMTLGMAGLAGADVFIKALTRELPVSQVMFLTGAGGAVVFGLWARPYGKLFSRDAFLRPVLLRNLFEVLGVVTLVIAIARAPLPVVSSVMQATPIFVTFGAAIFLGATVGWRRWVAVGVGFTGVLIIIRPGLSGFDPDALYALGGALGLAARDLATRSSPRRVSATQLSFYALGTVTLVSALMMLTGDRPVWPDAWQWLLTAGALACLVAGYYWVTVSMRTGEIAAVTPFRYTRLLFAVALALVFFGEVPDGWTVLGASVVIGSGLYALLRERHQARISPPAARGAAT